MVPPEKISGETNSADLMTKHLTGLLIKRHVDRPNLDFCGGMSEKVAKPQSIFKLERQVSAKVKTSRVDKSRRVIQGGFWGIERGDEVR